MPLAPNDVARAGGTTASGTDGPGSALLEDVHWLMARLARSLGVAEAGAIQGFGISLRAYVVLTEIVTGPPRNQLAVARAAAVDRSLLVGVLDELENSGLVVRRPDPADRRVRILEATPAGQDLQQRASAAVRDAEQRFLALLQPGAREELVQTLRTLAATGPQAGFDVTPCV